MKGQCLAGLLNTGLHGLGFQPPRHTNVAQGLATLLRPWVGRAFTVPGAGNMPFVAAWSELGLSWVTALEEKRGLTMAEGYVRAGGRLALMSTTAGPGASNLATGLLLALREQTSVFVVTGQTPRTYGARLPVQELDIKAFARELTLKAHELSAPEQLEGCVRELVRLALQPYRRGPVLLSVPADLWHAPCLLYGDADVAQVWNEEACTRCAHALRSAQAPLLIAGSGVILSGVAPALRVLAELLPQARVATTPRARGAFPAIHPQYAGTVGFGGDIDADLEKADLVFVLGSRLHEMSTNLDDRLYRKRLIQLDLDPLVPGKIFPAAGFCVDLRVALEDLAADLTASCLPQVRTEIKRSRPTRRVRG